MAGADESRAVTGRGAANCSPLRADRLRAAGRHPYVIPEGGSNALGSWGYVMAAQELADDLATPPERPTTIVYGLRLGAAPAPGSCSAPSWPASPRAASASPASTTATISLRVIGRICADFLERWPVGATVAPDDIEIVDGHVGRGYAKRRPEELATIRDLARRDGVILDPVYTGKAFHGIVTELARDRRPMRRGRRSARARPRSRPEWQVAADPSSGLWVLHNDEARLHRLAEQA
ncbi:MAG: pyridoxal-phosphate dependent enzyme [Gammaproteobacteria bacterium]|nr:pyridoxal-phosphate dependent enzyme [Gammaproteobacteria bacterium]